MNSIASTGTRPGAGSPWHDRRFRIFAAANTVNNLGEAVYGLTLPLLAYDLTRSLAVMGLLATTIPLTFVLDAPLGLVVDRYGPRALVLPGLCVQAAAALAMGLCVLWHVTGVAVLFLLALLVQFGASAYQTGWKIGVPSMFPDYPMRARGTLNTLYFASVALGPLSVAVALQWTGYLSLLWFNLLTFLAPIVVWIAGVRPPRASSAARRQRHRDALVEGVRAVHEERRLRVLLVVRAVLAVTFGPATLPLVLFALRHDWHRQASATSGVVAVYAVATLLGNICVAQGRRFRPRQALFAAPTLYLFAALALAAPSYALVLVGVALLGGASGVLLSTFVLMPLKYLHPSVLGRGSAFMGLVLGFASLLSSVVAVSLQNGIGTRWTYLVLAVGPVAALAYLRAAPWPADAEGAGERLDQPNRPARDSARSTTVSNCLDDHDKTEGVTTP